MLVGCFFYNKRKPPSSIFEALFGLYLNSDGGFLNGVLDQKFIAVLASTNAPSGSV